MSATTGPWIWQRAMSRWRRARARAHNERLAHSIVATAEDQAIVASVRGLTLTHPLRVHALLNAVAYVIARNVPGDFVECGVWRGGSVLAMIRKLQQLGVTDRDIYLYDTFEGMTEPTSKDTSAFEAPALATWSRALSEGQRAWNHLFKQELFSEQQVRETVLATGYPAERLHFVKGPVEQTLPGIAPARLALLRLDTDWYESTRHELECLYPRITEAGVLIIDDYGHWEGCRRAVDEYFARPDVKLPLINRVDYSARIAVKA